jgi:hypothetical protein
MGKTVNATAQPIDRLGFKPISGHSTIPRRTNQPRASNHFSRLILSHPVFALQHFDSLYSVLANKALSVRFLPSHAARQSNSENSGIFAASANMLQSARKSFVWPKCRNRKRRPAYVADFSFYWLGVMHFQILAT